MTMRNAVMPTRAVLALVQIEGANPYALAKAFKVSVSAAETRLHYMGREGLIS